MSRDHRKLRVFQEADELVPRVYVVTRQLPPEERYGLMSQIRRAAVSVPTNIVDGAARVSTPEYQRFLEIAMSSARENEYLFGLTTRLGFLESTVGLQLSDQYGRLSAGLSRLRQSLE
jgi:four helix bundle protein